MKSAWLALASSLMASTWAMAAADTLDPAVPTPRSVLGYEIGEYHTSYLGVVRYVEALARAVPERVKLVPIGESYERRPMMLLVISSPANMARLEQVQADLARLTDPAHHSATREAEEIIRASPAVTWDNFGNDGNESAAVEAALEMAYRLAASRGGEIEQALEQRGGGAQRLPQPRVARAVRRLVQREPGRARRAPPTPRPWSTAGPGAWTPTTTTTRSTSTATPCGPRSRRRAT